MKRNDDTIHWQNVQMYMFGLMFNVVRLTGEDIVAGLTQWEGGWGGAGAGGVGSGVAGVWDWGEGGGGGAHGHGVGVGAFGIDGEGMHGGHRGGGGGGRGSGGVTPLWFVRVFEGHGVLSTLVVLNLACAGLLISYVLKHVDAIAKVFATSMAMFITPLLSYLLFKKGLSLPMYLGVFTAACGINMYYMTPRDLLGHDKVLADDPDLARRELTVAEKQ